MRKVVVDVKVTSTDKMNEAFKEKDEKYREWASKETRETKVVMMPLITSHDGAVARPQEFTDEPEGPPERIATVDEKRE